MVNVKSLNPDDRTGLSASRLDGYEQSCHDSGYGESYGSKEESYWPQQWCALWPAQSGLDLILLAFFSLSRSFVISDRAFKKSNRFTKRYPESDLFVSDEIFLESKLVIITRTRAMPEI
jgi:hypothetical protein